MVWKPKCLLYGDSVLQLYANKAEGTPNAKWFNITEARQRFVSLEGRADLKGAGPEEITELLRTAKENHHNWYREDDTFNIIWCTGNKDYEEERRGEWRKRAAAQANLPQHYAFLKKMKEHIENTAWAGCELTGYTVFVFAGRGDRWGIEDPLFNMYQDGKAAIARETIARYRLLHPHKNVQVISGETIFDKLSLHNSFHFCNTAANREKIADVLTDICHFAFLTAISGNVRAGGEVKDRLTLFQSCCARGAMNVPDVAESAPLITKARASRESLSPFKKWYGEWMLDTMLVGPAAKRTGKARLNAEGLLAEIEELRQGDQRDPERWDIITDWIKKEGQRHDFPADMGNEDIIAYVMRLIQGEMTLAVCRGQAVYKEVLQGTENIDMSDLSPEDQALAIKYGVKITRNDQGAKRLFTWLRWKNDQPKSENERDCLSQVTYFGAV